MTPDEIKAKFVDEYIRAANLDAIKREMESGLPVGPGDFRIHMIAALETVAARIWDDGYIAAEWNYEEVCNCSAWSDGECACGNYGNGRLRARNPWKEAQ